MPANTTITLRKGTASLWSSSNPVLASGEPGYDVTNNILKIGNGINNWNSLSSINPRTIKETIILNSPSGTFNVSGGYTVGTLDIFLNGIKLSQYGDYTANDGSIFSLTDIAPSGSVIEYMAVSPTITDFSFLSYNDFAANVSGLLPIKNILAGPNVSITNSSGNYSIGVSGSLGLTTEEVDDRVASLLVAGTGININYDDVNNSLIVSSENYYGANRGTINVTSDTSSFNVPGGYTAGAFDLFLNGVKLVTDIDFTATNGYSFSTISPIPSGSVLEYISLTLANPLHIATDQYSAEISRDIISVTGSLSTINIVGGYDVGGLDIYKDGLKLIKNAQYTANDGATVTLNTPATSGSVIEYVSFISGKARRSINTISVSTIAGATPQTDYIYVATAPGITVTMPSAVANNSRYTIKNLSNGTINVIPQSGQTIDNQSIIAIINQYVSIDLVSNNQNWIII